MVSDLYANFIKSLNALTSFFRVVRRPVDDYFLKGVKGLKKIQSVKANVYHCLSVSALMIIAEATYQKSPWHVNAVVILSVILRLVMLKLKKFQMCQCFQTIYFAFLPLLYSRPNEQLLQASILPLLFSLVLYFFMLPLEYILMVSVSNFCIVTKMKEEALKIFKSLNNDIKISLIHNLYDGIFICMGIGLVFVALSRFQFDRILRDQKLLLRDLTETNLSLIRANRKQEQTLKLLETTNKELEQTKRQLEEALRAKDLLATFSHELRNSLNSLLGNIELLLEKATDNEQRQKIQVVKICGDLLLCLINNLLDAAKVAADKLEVSIVSVNMYYFLEKVWRINSVIIKQRNLTGELGVSKNLPKFLMVDHHRILQILMNLVSNSVRFTERGSVKIMISWAKIIDGEEELRPMLNPIVDSYFDTIQPIKHRRTQSSSNEPLKILTRSRTDFIPSSPRKQTTKDPKSCYDLEFETLPQVTEIDENDKVAKLKSFRQFSPKFMKDLATEKYFVFHSDLLNIAEALEDNSFCLTAFSHHKSKNGYLRIEIIDTGCGVHKEEQHKLFTQFSQEDRTSAGDCGSTGLGLYVIKNLIMKMNGHLKFVSEKNVGTHFTIHIPSEISTEPSDLL